MFELSLLSCSVFLPIIQFDVVLCISTCPKLHEPEVGGASGGRNPSLVYDLWLCHWICIVSGVFYICYHCSVGLRGLLLSTFIRACVLAYLRYCYCVGGYCVVLLAYVLKNVVVVVGALVVFHMSYVSCVIVWFCMTCARSHIVCVRFVCVFTCVFC